MGRRRRGPRRGHGRRACTAAPGWTTRVLDEGIDDITTAFVFDAQGVGHYAYSKDSPSTWAPPGRATCRCGWRACAPLTCTWRWARAAHGTCCSSRATRVGYAHDTGGVWQSKLLGEGWAAASPLMPRARRTYSSAGLLPRWATCSAPVPPRGAGT